MAILGLMGTEQFSSERFTNIRRSVFYFYPNGAAPLTGLLSLMKEERVNDPEFSWYEKRLIEQKSTTASANAIGPFTTAGGNVDKAQGGFSPSAGDAVRVKVAATANFRVGHVVYLRVLNGAASAYLDIRILISVIIDSTKFEGVFLEAYTSISNDTDANSVEVLVIGSAHEQGATGAALVPYNLPSGFGNYCQIFRSPFSLTGTALKTAAKFDETGPYKDKAKEVSIYHMIEMEKAFLFGVKSKSVDGTSGLPTYTSGGILSFLQLWEGGSTYGNTAATLDTDDNKRIIENSAGTINERTYDKYLERVFRITNNKANEKLVLCGSGFLSVINQLYKSKTALNTNIPSTEAYGMSVVEHVTPFGRIYYKTHPLFSQNANLRYNALFLDVQNLVYRYVDGRDTELLKNRQLPSADYRMDEWFTESGLEVRFPESCMYLKNVLTYTP